MPTKLPDINLRTLETARSEIYKELINAEAFLYGSAVEEPDIPRGLLHLEQARHHMQQFLNLCTRKAMLEIAKDSSLYISLKDKVWEDLKKRSDPSFDIGCKGYMFAVRGAESKILVYQQYVNRKVLLGHLERGKDFVCKHELCDDRELEDIRKAFESFERVFVNNPTIYTGAI